MVRDCNIFYERFGEGKPLVLLHGWTQTSSFWKPFTSLLIKEYQVIIPDLPGHGRTGLLDDDFTIGEAAEQTALFLREEIGPGFLAVGLSFGGILLLEIATRYPELIESMVLIGTVFDFSGAESGSENISWTDLPAAFREQLLRDHPLGKKQIDLLFNPRLQYEVHLTDKQLKSIKARTLVISGENDQIAGKDTAEALFKRLSDAELWIVSGKEHVAFDTSNAKEFQKRLLEFFG